ncbi:protein of unknown function [Shewanella benthica]|uniref:Uncharacterized protein n=1 Tax=Shewanella benthica TaxID=43661 RepID=A0A330M4J0_9GAMM|nr:protein of unknown function [Shewanella benthica]
MFASSLTVKDVRAYALRAVICQDAVRSVAACGVYAAKGRSVSEAFRYP